MVRKPRQTVDLRLRDREGSVLIWPRARHSLLPVRPMFTAEFAVLPAGGTDRKQHLRVHPRRRPERDDGCADSAPAPARPLYPRPRVRGGESVLPADEVCAGQEERRADLGRVQGTELRNCPFFV